MTETQNTKWKESWRDEYFKWVCGYENVQCGSYLLPSFKAK